VMVAYFKTPSQILPGETKENHGTPIRITGLQAEIRTTRDVPNMKLV